jgi:uncharacterized protein YjeT (DUF2065 family)
MNWIHIAITASIIFVITGICMMIIPEIALIIENQATHTITIDDFWNTLPNLLIICGVMIFIWVVIYYLRFMSSGA